MRHQFEQKTILEMWFLSFSTGQPHPLAEQPIVFIATKTLPLDISSLHFEIVGEFLVLLTTFVEWSENENMFFLVNWKKGKTHSVGVSGLQHIAPPLLIPLSSFSLPNGEPTHISISSQKTPSWFLA